MIALLGATGLLGRQVLKKLVEKKYPTRMFVRGTSDWKDVSVQNLKQHGVEISMGDITDSEAVIKALEGCNAIINLVGSMKPNPGVDIEELHVDAVQSLVDVAQEKGIERFIHVGCLGAKEHSTAEYFQTKWQAENIVRTGSFYWTVFKPSYMFGDKFPFLDIVMPLIKFPLCLPVLGSGANQIQPVCADNVAHCVVESIYDKEAVAKTYELGGPRIYTLTEFMEKARQGLGIRGPAIHIPTPTALNIVALINRLFPNSSINEAVMTLITASSFTDVNAIGAVFNLSPAPMDELFSKILDTY